MAVGERASRAHAAGVADDKAEAAQTTANEAKQAAADAAKGSAVVLGPPAVSIRSKIATGRPTDITLAPPTVMLLGGAIATYHIVVDDAPAVDVAATDNAATYSFTPGKPAGSTVRVSVTATDSLGNRSLPREVVADMVDGYVVTPTILSPVAGTRLKMWQFPVATSAFASYGVTDTHLSTDWMATSDLDRTEVLHQAIGSTDLTAHNVPGISVAADMPVYLWARHHGHVPSHKSLWHCAPGCGLPIGNLTSQFFSNVYLDGLDKYAKHKLKARWYARYVDDLVLLSHSRDQLYIWKEQIEEWLFQERGLRLHPDKISVKPANSGINFVGTVVLPYRNYPRKMTRSAAITAAKEVRKHPLSKDALASLNSYIGMFRHTSSYRLRERLCKMAETPVVTGHDAENTKVFHL